MGKVVKGFVKLQDKSERPHLEIPEGYSPTPKELDEFFIEAQKAEMPPRAFGLFKMLASLPPAVRLGVNIKTTAASLAVRDSPDYEYGLSANEIGALYELEFSAVSGNLKLSAWSLLNIRERRVFVECLGDEFKKLRVVKTNRIELNI